MESDDADGEGQRPLITAWARAQAGADERRGLGVITD